MSAAGKGRVFSDQHRANLSAAQKERERTDFVGKQSLPIQTPDGVFESALEYAKFIGRARITVYKRIAKYPGLYSFINKEAAE
jgi:hypothetical protein